MSSQSSGRHRLNMDEFSAEEEALSIISEAADIRIAAKKAFMAEAKEIRSKENEKQQKESESEEEGICNNTAHDAAAVGTESVDLEKKYKAAMVNSAQLNNENQSLVYEVDLLKDQMEQLGEEHTELQRHYKEKCREYDFQKRDLQSLEKDFNILKQQLEITSKLLAESGFIILVNEKGEPVLEKSSQVNLSNSNSVFLGSAFLVSTESHNLLKKTEETSSGTAAAAVKPSSGTAAAAVKTSAGGIQVYVDEVDGSTFAKVSDYSKDGAHGVALHDINITATSEHEVVNVEPLQGVDSNRISTGEQSLVSGSGIVSQCQETEKSSLSVLNSACLGTERESVSVDDEVDEFFDAVSTPSPSSKTGSYDEQGVYDQNEFISDGSSVDPEIRILEAPSHSSTERQSIILENVTETESSTDIIDESEELGDKENATEDECITDTTNQNENVDTDSLKEVIEGNEEQSVVLETSNNSLTEVDDVPNEISASADNVIEEAIPENKPEEENRLGNGETLEFICKASQEVVCDMPQDVGPSDAAANPEEELVEEQNKSDITQSLSCEVPGSNSMADLNFEINVSAPCLSEETFQIHTEKQEEDEIVVEEIEDAELVEISDSLNAEGATDVRDTQDVEQEGGVTESIIHDNHNINFENGPEALVASSTTEILSEDASEKPDRDNKTEKEEGEGEQLSENTLNLQSENKEGETNLICSETETGEPEVTGFEENASCSAEPTNYNTEENKCEDDPDFPVKDSSKLVVRTTSIGGSEASEGAVIDDYDLDDIDDVLQTDVPLAAGADLNTTPTIVPDVLAVTATGPLDHENNGNAKSPSKIDVEKEEGTKAKGSKKTKSEKGKTGKKSHAEKAEKIKSGEKESKDKAEKTKNKESKDKTEKIKSSKKESAHEKKAEKSKNKKDVAPDSRSESVSGEEDRHSIAESQTSLEPDDLEGALDKQMLESEKLKSPKKSSKKLSIFKKVFK